MTSRTALPIRRPFALVVGTIVALCLATLLTAAPASAHDELVGSSPAAGSEVDALPAELVLTFSAVLLDEPGATAVVVTDAGGTDLTDGAPVLDGVKVRQALVPDSSAGPVTVVWRVVSSDGHPVSERFSFTVGAGAPAPDATPTTAPETPMEGTDMTWLLWSGGAVAILVVLGVAFFLVRPRNQGPREH